MLMNIQSVKKGVQRTKNADGVGVGAYGGGGWEWRTEGRRRAAHTQTLKLHCARAAAVAVAVTSELTTLVSCRRNLVINRITAPWILMPWKSNRTGPRACRRSAPHSPSQLFLAECKSFQVCQHTHTRACTCARLPSAAHAASFSFGIEARSTEHHSRGLLLLLRLAQRCK